MICDKIVTDNECNTIVRDEPFEIGYVYIYILQLNKYDGSTVNQTFVRENKEDEIKFTIGQDGFYTLCSLKVPTSEIFPYYYKRGKLYKDAREVTLQEIVEVNSDVSGIEKNFLNYFQTCKLEQCFKKLALDIINANVSNQCSFNKASSEDIYKRDLVWSALKVIKLLVEKDNFEEAQRLLERITGCNGLCTDPCYTNKPCGCGCGH